jgi:hypothetical protein
VSWWQVLAVFVGIPVALFALICAAVLLGTPPEASVSASAAEAAADATPDPEGLDDHTGDDRAPDGAAGPIGDPPA